MFKAKRTILKTLLGVTLLSGVMAVSTHAQAAGMACGDRTALLKALSDKYKETPRALGLSSSGKAMFEVFTSKAGTWTIVMTTHQGRYLHHGRRSFLGRGHRGGRGPAGLRAQISRYQWQDPWRLPGLVSQAGICPGRAWRGDVATGATNHSLPGRSNLLEQARSSHGGNTISGKQFGGRTCATPQGRLRTRSAPVARACAAG